MILRGGRDRAGRLAGLLVVASAMAACSGQSPEPKEYGLGNADPVKTGTLQVFAIGADDVVHFGVESTDLSAEAEAALRKQVRWLNRHPNARIIIEGHADERGTRAHNFALGAERAMTVKRFLVGNGVSATRIQTVSYGNEQPVAVCDDASCWSQNRRVKTALKTDRAALD